MSLYVLRRGSSDGMALIRMASVGMAVSQMALGGMVVGEMASSAMATGGMVMGRTAWAGWPWVGRPWAGRLGLECIVRNGRGHNSLKQDGPVQHGFRCTYLGWDGLRWEAWDAMTMGVGNNLR